MLAARLASMRAMSWGVETMTAPERAQRCESDRWMSPVPGGRSTTSTSSGAQSVWCSICSMAVIAMGPRQIVGLSSATRLPMLSVFSP